VASQITSVAAGGFLQIDGTQARITIGSSTTSAVGGLTSNDGTVNFDGNCDLGAGGSNVTTSGGFDNSDLLWIDMYGGDGGTTVHYGGVPCNSGTGALGK